MWSRNLPFHTLQWISLLASLFYAIVAVAMGVINKAVIIDFQYPNTFLTLQVSRHVLVALQDQELRTWCMDANYLFSVEVFLLRRLTFGVARKLKH
jgi:hypothetical protein